LVEAAMVSAVVEVDDGVARVFDDVLSRDRARLRARLVLLGAAAVSEEPAPPAVIVAAAAAELLHLAQHHHDVRRRGEADVTSVLVGDHLMARTMQLAVGVDAGTGEALARCVVAHVRGQLLDDRDRYDTGRTPAAYDEACRHRTAMLTSAAAGLGARLAGGHDEQVAALQGYGERLGLALQLADDLHGVVADGESDDLRTGIYTLPTLVALHEHGELRAVLGRSLDRAALAHATQVVQRSEGVGVALTRIHAHVTDAVARLDGVPWSAGLDEMAQGVGYQAWRWVADQPTIALPG
jgi:geranylgeranyl pyrophosphate synthase